MASNLHRAFCAWPRVFRRRRMQADEERGTGLHSGPVVSEAVGELETKHLGVETDRGIHVRDVDTVAFPPLIMVTSLLQGDILSTHAIGKYPLGGLANPSRVECCDSGVRPARCFSGSRDGD